MPIKDAHLDRRVVILKAIAHPLRLQIIAILCQRDEHVSGLAGELEVSQAIISQQLRILRMSQLVDVSRQNGYSVYTLAEPHLKTLIDCMERCCSKS